MKKEYYKYTVLLLLAVLFATACNHSGSPKATSAIPELIERKDTAGKSGEWNTINELYEKYSKAVATNPNDHKSRIKLAEVYINEARISGAQGYYYNAAIKMLNYVINAKPEDRDVLYLALANKATVLLSLHQFAAAKKVADEALAINTYDAGIYGALVDANVELGNYDEAVKNCDKMLEIRPDLRSYSRASYLRQIYGDNAGAINAMQMAVTAGVPGVESTEWARVTLGDLYLNTGKPDSAQIEYGLANMYRPGYAPALLGLAKVERAEKHYDAAIDTTKSAIRVLSESAYVAFLGDLYELKGDEGKAKEIRSDVLELLEEGEKEQPEEADAKHNANRELATASMHCNKLDDALRYAKQDLQMRPENIDANELTAWIYYLKGDYANAKLHADKMLKTNTKNAATLYKAGVIYQAAGDAEKGSKLKAEALAINKYLDELLVKPVKAV
jgi:tetratricopeptide (TPR) repeat protein